MEDCYNNTYFKAGGLLALCNYKPISIVPVSGVGQNILPLLLTTVILDFVPSNLTLEPST